MFTFVGTSISLPLFLLELGFEIRRVDGLERTLRAHPPWMQYETVDLFQMIGTAPDYGITHARKTGRGSRMADSRIHRDQANRRRNYRRRPSS